jgi:YVTN family beta-propeller protein
MTITVTVGSQACALAVHPSGSAVYVANFGDNTVSVVDTATNMVTAIAVGNGPIGAAIGPLSLPVGGSATGLTPAAVLCRNVTTAQTIQFQTSDASWDCEAAGLAVNPGDKVRTGVQGTAH